jgi:hypothetical protein
MSKFEPSPFTPHKFDMFNANKFGVTQFKLNVQEAFSDAVPIWELQGMTKEQYYEKYPPTPVWEILKITEDEWRERYMPKTLPTAEVVADTSANSTEAPTGSTETKEDTEPVKDITDKLNLIKLEEHIEPVKSVINTIESKIQKRKPARKVKWT